MSDKPKFTITSDKIDHSVIQFDSTSKSVSVGFVGGPLRDKDGATHGDQQAQFDAAWVRLVDILHELSSHKDVQALFAEQGLKIEGTHKSNNTKGTQK